MTTQGRGSTQFQVTYKIKTLTNIGMDRLDGKNSDLDF